MGRGARAPGQPHEQGRCAGVPSRRPACEPQPPARHQLLPWPLARWQLLATRAARCARCKHSPVCPRCAAMSARAPTCGSRAAHTATMPSPLSPTSLPSASLVVAASARMWASSSEAAGGAGADADAGVLSPSGEGVRCRLREVRGELCQPHSVAGAAGGRPSAAAGRAVRAPWRVTAGLTLSAPPSKNEAPDTLKEEPGRDKGR